MEKILLWTNPADPALAAVVLLLVAIEEVADVAVILPEEVVAALAALLGLLQEAATGALHLGHTEAVQAVPLGAIVAQPAGVQLPAARRLRTVTPALQTRRWDTKSREDLSERILRLFVSTRKC